MLENTEGAINNGQSRETGNIGYTDKSTLENTEGAIKKQGTLDTQDKKRRQTKLKKYQHNVFNTTICKQTQIM